MQLALRRIGMTRNEIGKRPFAGGDDSFDRINLRHGCEWSRSLGPTRSPTWLLANPATPSIGAVIFVYPRLISACFTAASSASTFALVESAAATAVSRS